jgi:hypothetical protein
MKTGSVFPVRYETHLGVVTVRRRVSASPALLQEFPVGFNGPPTALSAGRQGFDSIRA